KSGQDDRINQVSKMTMAAYKVERVGQVRSELTAQGRFNDAVDKRLVLVEAKFAPHVPLTADDKATVANVRQKSTEMAKKKIVEKWGLIGTLGLNDKLVPIDEKTRSNFMPYGFSGMMLGAALVFFAFIGFDSISTHAEEAIKPQRDVPIGIIASLLVCTILYIAVSAVITGMQAYLTIDTKAAIATAFDEKAKVENSGA